MPRRDIRLDSSGNRLLSGNGYAFADGEQAVKQGIEVRVKLFRGEYWLDQSKGVDWIGTIFARGTNRVVIEAALASAIAETPDVTRVAKAGYTPPDAATRHAAVSYLATTTEGTIEGSVNA